MITLFVNPSNSETAGVIRDMPGAAGTMGVQIPVVRAGGESEIDAAFGTLVRLQTGALVGSADPGTSFTARPGFASEGFSRARSRPVCRSSTRSSSS
jgi:hypothetical protein